MLTLAEVAQGSAGRLCSTGLAGRVIDGISTDSRHIQPGDLFIALRGENFDGHDFVRKLLAQTGAVAALVDETWWQQQSGQAADLPVVVVANTRLALGALAASWRSRFTLPLIGLTGSNGKTTVKEMIAAILRQQYPQTRDSAETVLATQGNLNNDIGLPLMLLRLRAGHQAAVLEMGMNHPGEIDYLSRLSCPDVVLINNAQRAHLEGLGDLEAVARAKAEIFHGLRAGGTAVLNADDGQAALWRELAVAAGIENQLEFGFTPGAAVTGQFHAQALGGLLELQTPQGRAQVQLQVPGVHNARNALAAAAACLAAGMGFDAVVAGLNSYRGVAGRLQLRPGLQGALIIDDSYNANPDSLRAAIDVLAAQSGHRILVLGDMGEVGAQLAAVHTEIGCYARSQGIDELLALGEQTALAVHAFGHGAEHFHELESLQQALCSRLQPQTTVLVKGSRFMRMERVVRAIGEVSS